MVEERDSHGGKEVDGMGAFLQRKKNGSKKLHFPHALLGLKVCQSCTRNHRMRWNETDFGAVFQKYHRDLDRGLLHGSHKALNVDSKS